MRTIAAILLASALVFGPAAEAAGKGLTVRGVRHFSYPGFTRIVFEIESAAPYVMTRSGDGRSLYFSSYGGPFSVAQQHVPVINDSVVKGLELRQDGDQRAIVIALASDAGEVKDFVLRGPDRIVLDVLRGTAPAAPAPERPAARQPVIAIDPGHGGADTGVVTGQGVEKTITLELANLVARSLRKGGSKAAVLLTRERDAAIPPEERAAAANAAEARVFVSLHAANGSDVRVLILDADEGPSPATGGTPADFLGFDAASEQQQTLWGTQQAEHARESGRLGRAVIRALPGGDAAEPVQAPLAILRPVAAAAVLVEVGAAQNRSRIAESIARGIEQYVREQR